VQGKQGSPAAGPNSEAATAVALRAYFGRKRPMIVWSVVIAIPVCLLVAVESRVAAVALAFGTLCGIANALLSMRSNERLVDHRSVGIFVISSVLRILIFGILPVEFALHGPWWSFGIYFGGFFLPLAVYAVGVGRAARTS
jgi:hypothetical protein